MLAPVLFKALMDRGGHSAWGAVWVLVMVLAHSCEELMRLFWGTVRGAV